MSKQILWNILRLTEGRQDSPSMLCGETEAGEGLISSLPLFIPHSALERDFWGNNWQRYGFVRETMGEKTDWEYTVGNRI